MNSVIGSVEVKNSAPPVDEVSPVVLSSAISETSVDVGAQDAKITVTIRVSDNAKIRTANVSCDNAMNPSVEQIEVIDNSNGLFKDVTYKFEVPFSAGAKPGISSCEAFVSDIYNNSINSAVATVKVYRTPPGQSSAPLGLNFKPFRPTTGILTWTQPSNLGKPALVAYVMEFSLDGEVWLKMPKSGTKVTSLEVSGMKADTDHWFRVRGENGGTAGQDTTFMNLSWATLKVHTPKPVVADAPTALVVSNVTSSGYTVAWTASAYNGGAAITDFKVEVSSDAGKSWKVAKQGPSTSSSLTVSGAAPGATYQVRVAAINAVGQSDFLTGSVKTSATSPTAARNLTASQPTISGLTLSWQLPSTNGGSEITDYRVEVSSNCNTFTEIKRSASKNLGFKVTGLKAGTKYCFRVSAVNAVGVSATSTVVSAVTAGNAPSAPTSLSVKASKTSVVLAWKASTVINGGPIKSFIVEYSKNNGGTWLKVKTTPSTSRSLTITGLKTKTNYLFRVTATNDVGNSAASKSLKVTTP